MPEVLDRPSYETDFYAWALDQAARLRAQAALRPNEPIDWKLLAEEVEGLARSDWRACASLVEQILVHLLKLAFSTAREPRAHWAAEVTAFRLRLEDLLTTTLRRQLEAELPRRYANAFKLLAAQSRAVEPGLMARVPASCPWTLDQILGDFLPEPPTDPA